jgi:hypothetical protein
MEQWKQRWRASVSTLPHFNASRWKLTITLGHIGRKKKGVGGGGGVLAQAGLKAGPEMLMGLGSRESVGGNSNRQTAASTHGGGVGDG